jgi:hypothetical protein
MPTRTHLNAVHIAAVPLEEGTKEIRPFHARHAILQLSLKLHFELAHPVLHARDVEAHDFQAALRGRLRSARKLLSRDSLHGMTLSRVRQSW